MIVLQNATTRLELLPELGGAIASWTLLASGQPLLQSPVGDRYSWGKVACFPLVPWSNRIEHGGYQSAQGWLQLRCVLEDEPYPIHGTGWHQAWEAVEQSAQTALLRLVSEEPYPYQAEQKIALNEQGLLIELSVVHQGHEPAWYGIGLHPFFPRWKHTRLQASARAVWFEKNQRFPRHERKIEGDWCFTKAKELPATLIDHAFSGWNGEFSIIQPDAGYRLECLTEHSDTFILYTPPDKDFFCFEPVSHPINAHHLQDRPGLRLLQAGQRIDMKMLMQPIALPAMDQESTVTRLARME
ncbi:aldose 1-epimerase [Azomonas macrocytogenes]|uniref:Aldose 1-epimerase n=1 Tax=Azomonas macrocytogenes TaxID=69962 RepID=A0A839T6R5_AZOMA|nr:aldose 1-epimerase [Azomonas macrocytogenes]MBB3105197.1 aldose 1-epimerase [Azomonas macrocytogenes]